MTHDMVERMRAAQSLLEQESTLRFLLNSLTDMIGFFDVDGELLYASAAHPCLVPPRCTDEWLTAIREEHRYEVMKAVQKYRRTRQPFTIQYQYQDARNGWRWLESNGLDVVGGEGNIGYLVIVSKDITVQKEKEEHLISLAYCDPLTGLPNRRMLLEHLTRSLAYAKRNSSMLALLYLDVDDFKLINDSLGHEIGDEFLLAFAKKVKGCIRDIDTLARFGGDEFVILLPIIDSAASAEKVVQRIYSQVSHPWNIKGRSFTASVSIGIAVYPMHSDEENTLLRFADMALYQAKHAGGKGYVLYSEALHSAAGNRSRLTKRTANTLSTN